MLKSSWTTKLQSAPFHSNLPEQQEGLQNVRDPHIGFMVRLVNHMRGLLLYFIGGRSITPSVLIKFVFLVLVNWCKNKVAFPSLKLPVHQNRSKQIFDQDTSTHCVVLLCWFLITLIVFFGSSFVFNEASLFIKKIAAVPLILLLRTYLQMYINDISDDLGDDMAL